MAFYLRVLRPATIRGLASLTATLMLGACAETSDILPKSNLASTMQDGDEDTRYEGTQTELQKATTYWGKEFASRPSELKPALNYARNLKALGEKQKAMMVLQKAATLHDSDPELAGEYGRLALELDQTGIASRMLEIADNPAKPDWKVISARGTVMAQQGKYKEAIPFYERALTLSNNQPSVLNNLAMAHAMGGDAKKAEELLRQAAATTGVTPKVKQNLALVLGLQGRYDEAKAIGGTAVASDTASANVDLLRQIVKIDSKSAPASAVATLQAPDFKTKVTRALAVAPKAPTAPAVASAVTFKPATVDTATAESLTSQASAEPQSAASIFKGSSQ